METKGKYEIEALEYIAKLADGGCRDAITMLDKCLAYSKDLTLENVVKALGVADYDTMMKLTDYIIGSDRQSTLEILEKVYMSGVDLKQFIKQYMEFIFEVIKSSLLKDISKTQLPNTDDIEKWLITVKTDKCHKLLDILVELHKELKYSTTPKFLVEYMLSEVVYE